jgi:hypothetical protein
MQRANKGEFMQKYESPVLEIVAFASQDVIATSGRNPIETEEDIFW